MDGLRCLVDAIDDIKVANGELSAVHGGKKRIF
jgi:hypothetical protein